MLSLVLSSSWWCSGGDGDIGGIWMIHMAEEALWMSNTFSSGFTRPSSPNWYTDCVLQIQPSINAHKQRWHRRKRLCLCLCCELYDVTSNDTFSFDLISWWWPHHLRQFAWRVCNDRSNISHMIHTWVQSNKKCLETAFYSCLLSTTSNYFPSHIFFRMQLWDDVIIPLWSPDSFLFLFINSDDMYCIVYIYSMFC